MDARVASSLTRDGVRPGGLGVRRRARAWAWYERLLGEAPTRRPALLEGVGQPSGAGRQRGERLGPPGRHRADQRGPGIVPAVLHYATYYVPAVADGGPPRGTRPPCGTCSWPAL
ncbi:hypothetical protein GCM10009790_15000 [Georgenia ruanii]